MTRPFEAELRGEMRVGEERGEMMGETGEVARGEAMRGERGVAAGFLREPATPGGVGEVAPEREPPASEEDVAPPERERGVLKGS